MTMYSTAHKLEPITHNNRGEANQGNIQRILQKYESMRIWQTAEMAKGSYKGRKAKNELDSDIMSS